MARRPLISTGLSRPVPPPVTDTKFVQAGILRVDETGKIDPISKTKGLLLLNPENIVDEKASNWIITQIPGQSNPSLSWAHGGPRNVSFDALVTKDTSDFLGPKTSDPLAGVLDQGINAIGDIASSFAGVSIPLGSILAGGGEPGPGEDLSIENELNYYRSLEYPIYSGNSLYGNPPLIVLAFGRMLGSLNTIATDEITAEHDVWVLTSLRIQITKTLPNLTPMEAMVSFAFVQYTMYSFGREHFGDHALPTGTVGQGSLGSVISGGIKGLF